MIVAPNRRGEKGGFSRKTTGGRKRRNASRRLTFFALYFLLSIRTAPLMAQTTSIVQGTVGDPQGLPIAGAQIKTIGSSVTSERTATTDSAGFYRIAALPSGAYTLTATNTGFATRHVSFELTLNRTLNLDVVLEVGQVQEEVTVQADTSGLDATASSTGATITPRQITEMPINGRNYLDLMQLVPGVAINRQADPGTDTAVPVLGERGGNTIFLIDGLPNQDAFSGGAAAQFNQETIAEFQVLTTGYKAEFGRGSGGVVNVVTKSGTNDWHGAASLFYRNDTFDSSKISGQAAPRLRRSDYSLASGGPIIRNRLFFFGTASRIAENRRLNFVFPQNTPQRLRGIENGFDNPAHDSETRLFARLDEQLGRQRLTGQMSLTNRRLSDFLPLSRATALPSTRQDFGVRSLMLGIIDTVLMGSRSNPVVLTIRGQYRGEPSDVQPSHPEAGPSTQLEMFSSLTTNRFFGNLGQVTFGAPFTPSNLNQKYISLSADLARYGARHNIKFGGSFTRTPVDGMEANLLFNLLFATLDDFNHFGPVNSGLFTLRTRAGARARDNLIRLRNNYTGLFVQDDWKIRPRLTLNLGLRWDYDSTFSIKRNFSPRLGFAWTATPRTVVRGSWGIFYDQFRLGTARDVPQFGGANISNLQPVSYPRLFYGVPTILPVVLGLCLSSTMTDAQIASTGAGCRLGPLPLIGVDRLNRVVAPGRAPIPPDAVVTIANVQSLTGLSPQEFVDQASLAVGRPPGYFFWGPFGVLTQTGSPTTAFPVTVDSSFRTPYTRSFNLGVQREISRDITIGVDYFHKDIRNVLGVRLTNINLLARLPGFERRFDPPSPQQEIRGFGPWFKGRFDALSLSFSSRLGRRFSLAGSYTYTRAIDNLRCSDLVTGLSVCVPSDSFIGVPPVIIDPKTGQTNAGGPFTASNGNPVPQAGIFYNGPNFDRGPSDLALAHTFLAYGSAELPWGFEIGGIFRAQSGFRFSRQAAVPLDVDGDQNFNTIDHAVGRNAFTAPWFINTDIRLSRRWKIGERVRLTTLLEFFNLFNRRNPAAVETGEGRPVPFGQPLQVLPGREGQVGLRIEF